MIGGSTFCETLVELTWHVAIQSARGAVAVVVGGSTFWMRMHDGLTWESST